jgi:hypothetical protein
MQTDHELNRSTIRVALLMSGVTAVFAFYLGFIGKVIQ